MADSNDVGRIQYVLDNYDSVEDGGTTDAYWETKENGKNRRARTVVFSKKVNGTYYVVEAAPVTKAKSLYVVTAYMQKNRTPQRLLDANASQFTSETSNADSVLPDDSLSHIVEKSKGKIAAPAPDPKTDLEALRKELAEVEKQLFSIGMDDPYGPEPANTKEGQSLLDRKAALETKIAKSRQSKDSAIEMQAGKEYNNKTGGSKYANDVVRTWYVEQVSKILEGIDPTLPLEERAQQAFDRRNNLRSEARGMMADEEMRKILEKTRPNMSFEELVQSKMRRKNMTREEAIRDIYSTATKTNEHVNREFGLRGD